MTFGPVLAQSFDGIIVAALSIWGMIREVDIRMTLLALAPVPFAAAATIILGNQVQKRFGRVQTLFSKLSGFVNESIGGIKVTKAFAKESVREKDFAEISDDMREANVNLARASSLINPAVTASFGLSYAGRADSRRQCRHVRLDGRGHARHLLRLSAARTESYRAARKYNQPYTARSRLI